MPSTGTPPATPPERRDPGNEISAARGLGPVMTDVPTATVAGVPVHLVDERQARSIIIDAARLKDAPLGVSSVNIDHIHHTLDGSYDVPSPGLQWLNLIDGLPIAHQAWRMTGVRYPRLAGSDLASGVIDDSAAAHLCLGVLGGSPAAAPALRESLARDWPTLQFGGHWSPTRETLSDRGACEGLAAEAASAGVDVLLVCLGKPRQERWIAEYGALTGAGVLLAFGAVVDFLGGRVSRAPRWVSATGMEWMWRLMLEPRRLAHRYLIEGPPAYVAVRRSDSSPRGHGPSTR
ncbi:WecB/TagA/CpsF family glycosyltransferase [Microbacterium sp. zg.Y909]|uniref:WecB/TagA/CpsF family glycosyltransferase n=1 Tax=Microbacterium sp. zg.Y909 TaxID=2969413 RepID=UPI00214BDE15|nr:WecB/TagA/CpsF family glycosyltransferase [Microbacterium sp. zg.Y909]MCR2823910.1 WecB/TagA/CpsF family glycosyltransferase [Microbacterium sp. zg.Y909]